MNWLAYGIAAVFLAWAVYRFAESYRFRKLMDTMTGELTDPVLRPFLDRLSNQSVPNVAQAWARLHELEQRVQAAPKVSLSLKSELKSLLEAKGHGF